MFNHVHFRSIVTVCAAFALSAPVVYGADCQPSKWGAGDQIGNSNHITKEKTLAASKLVTTGKAYRLGMETNRMTPAYPPRNYAVTVLQPGQVGGVTIGPNKLNYNDDIVMGWNGVGSQIDGFGHIGIDNMYYNCNKGADFAQVTGLTKLGIETVPALATRGILLDMAGLLGNGQMLKEGTAFNQAEIEAAMKRQGIKSIEKGDVVLFYTGWLSLVGKDDKRYNGGEPGLGVGGARYLGSLGVAAVGADSWGLEVLPFEKDAGVWRTPNSSARERYLHS